MLSEAIQYDHHITGMQMLNRGVTTYWYKGVKITHRADGKYHTQGAILDSKKLAELHIDLSGVHN